MINKARDSLKWVKTHPIGEGEYLIEDKQLVTISQTLNQAEKNEKVLEIIKEHCELDEDFNKKYDLVISKIPKEKRELIKEWLEKWLI